MQRFNVKIRDSEEARAQAASYRGSLRTGNQLYRQPEHRQPVIAAARAQAKYGADASETAVHGNRGKVDMVTGKEGKPRETGL